MAMGSPCTYVCSRMAASRSLAPVLALAVLSCNPVGVSLGGGSEAALNTCETRECSASGGMCLNGSLPPVRECSRRVDGSCGWVLAGCPAQLVGTNTATITGTVEGDGPRPPEPSGSECRVGQESYRLELTTKSITFSRCKGGVGERTVRRIGSGSVAPSAIGAIIAAVDAMMPATGLGCGSPPQGHARVDIARTDGTLDSYEDGELRCADVALQVYASGVVHVVETMRAAIGNP